MKRISLAGHIERIVNGSGEAISRKHLAGISVTSLQVDTSQFHSSDFMGKREGMISLTVAGQDSLFAYSGENVIDVPCSSQIAFLGTFPGDIPIAIRVIESDKKARDAFLKGETFAASAATLFTGSGIPLAGNGLNTVSTLLGVLGKLAGDNDEAVAFAVIEDKLSDAATIDIKLGQDPARPLLALQLTVREFGKQDTFRTVAVRICEPWLEFPNEKISERRKSATGKGSRRKNYCMREWLTKKKGIKSLLFSAASGRHKAGMELPFRQVEALSHWQKYELFRVASAKAVNRHIVPVSLSFSLNSDSPMLEPILGLIRAGADLAGEANPENKTTAGVVSKAGRSYGDLVSEFSPRELLLCQFDGGLLLLPEGVSSRPGFHGGKLELENRQPGLWRGSVVCEVRKWRKQPLGSFGFDVEVSSVS